MANGKTRVKGTGGVPVLMFTKPVYLPGCCDMKARLMTFFFCRGGIVCFVFISYLFVIFVIFGELYVH
jgi:hypothetical protein